MFKAGPLGPFLSLLLLCSCATENPVGSTLPAEVPINQEAGRGGSLVVTVRLESGEELPFLVDTGTSFTFFDKSLEPKLGKPIGTRAFQSWGVESKVNVYAAPKLYLAGAPLMMPSTGIVTDNCQQWPSAAGRPTMGMLGFDCLRHYCIQLDFAAAKMRFLDDEKADKQKWGKAFPIVPLNSRDGRPAVSLNLFGAQSPHSLIDSGFLSDGWLMPQYFQQWTNQAVPPARGEARWPNGLFGGEKYPFVALPRIDVESDGLGLRFLARHLVTLDFPKQTMYLRRQSIGPLPDPTVKTTRMEALEPMIKEVLQEDVGAARKALVRMEHSRATALEKTVARKLAAALENEPKPAPADAPPAVTQLPLGDARPELAEVGWLKPAANRIPLNEHIASPLLDSGRVYATGLFAHAPSRYVYALGGKWKTLRGEAGLHTAFQPYAYGIVYVIKTDGKEVFRSSVIRGASQAHYDIDVAGVRTLELLVEKAYDQNGCNWSLWLDPTLFRESFKNTDGHQ
jgi:NPCBM/NEW2 domain